MLSPGRGGEKGGGGGGGGVEETEANFEVVPSGNFRKIQKYKHVHGSRVLPQAARREREFPDRVFTTSVFATSVFTTCPKQLGEKESFLIGSDNPIR